MTKQEKNWGKKITTASAAQRSGTGRRYVQIPTTEISACVMAMLAKKCAYKDWFHREYRQVLSRVAR
jgi:hypothetical protein